MKGHKYQRFIVLVGLLTLLGGTKVMATMAHYVFSLSIDLGTMVIAPPDKDLELIEENQGEFTKSEITDSIFEKQTENGHFQETEKTDGDIFEESEESHELLAPIESEVTVDVSPD